MVTPNREGPNREGNSFVCNLTRRAALGALAAVPVAGVPPAVAGSLLDVRVQDYFCLKTAYEALLERCDELVKAGPPRPGIQIGTCTPDDIDRAVKRWRDNPERLESLAKARQELEAQIQVYEDWRQSSGIEQLDESIDRLFIRFDRLRHEIMFHRPQTMHELEARDLVLRDMLNGGYEITEDELLVIFGDCAA